MADPGPLCRRSYPRVVSWPDGRRDLPRNLRGAPGRRYRSIFHPDRHDRQTVRPLSCPPGHGRIGYMRLYDSKPPDLRGAGRVRDPGRGRPLLRVLSAPGDRQSVGFGPGGDRIPAACLHARPPSSATPPSSRQWEAGGWTESPGCKYHNVLEPEFRSGSSPIPRPGSFCGTAGSREPQHRQSKEPDNGLRNGHRRPGKNCTVRLFGRTLLPPGLPKVRL